MRQHHSHKVELVRLCTEEQGEEQLEALTTDAESIARGIGSALSSELLCSGDTGFSASKTYDLEVWLPSQGRIPRNFQLLMVHRFPRTPYVFALSP